ncbi:MAG TPA: hypothetical protein VGA22_02850 [Gemmatimonadales bacterium]|jgi:hypothetical protein
MRRSIAVILNAGGMRLDASAVADLPLARVERLEVASGTGAAAAAATVRHNCSRSEFSRALRAWANARGWSVTVAPLPSRD